MNATIDEPLSTTQAVNIGAEYSAEETAYIRAVWAWQKRTGRKFPAAVDYLRILKSLGYALPTETETVNYGQPPEERPAPGPAIGPPPAREPVQPERPELASSPPAAPVPEPGDRERAPAAAEETKPLMCARCKIQPRAPGKFTAICQSCIATAHRDGLARSRAAKQTVGHGMVRRQCALCRAEHVLRKTAPNVCDACIEKNERARQEVS